MSEPVPKRKKKSKSPIAIKKVLSDKEDVFVNTYLANGYNGTRAAEKAGYACPRSTATKMLSKGHIRAEIDQHLAEIGVTREKVLLEDAKTAFDTDMSSYEDFLHGATLKELKGRGIDTRQVKKITRKVDKDGGESHSIELHSRDKAIDRLARALGMGTEIKGANVAVAIKQIIYASGKPPPEEFANPATIEVEVFDAEETEQHADVTLPGADDAQHERNAGQHE